MYLYIQYIYTHTCICISTLLSKERASWGFEWADVYVTNFLKKYYILLLEEAGRCWFPLPTGLSILLPKEVHLFLFFFFTILTTPGEKITSCYVPSDHYRSVSSLLFGKEPKLLAYINFIYSTTM